MKIWNIALEPIETRYTIDWNVQFPEVYKKTKNEYEMIYGEKIKSELKGKFFLDPINTNIWKLTQMTQLLKRIDEIKEDDVVFFHDLWFPSLEVLPYIKHLTEKKIKICGILHAGTYDVNDLTNQTGMTRWAKHMEEAWFDVVDKIFVATQYHKDIIVDNRMVDPKKIIVTGLPIDFKKLKYYKSKTKEGIIFTGRKSKEKGLDTINEFSKELDINIVIDKNYNKQQYLTALGKSKIVFAPSEQETFGYGIVEGMAMDCIPVVPDKLSFKETVPKRFRYSTLEEAKNMIIKNKNNDENLSKYVKKYDYKNVIGKMIKEMKNIGDTND